MQRCHLKRHRAFRRVTSCGPGRTVWPAPGKPQQLRQGITRRGRCTCTTTPPLTSTPHGTFWHSDDSLRPDAGNDSHFFPADLLWSMPLTGFNPSSFTMTESPPGLNFRSRLIATELSHVEYVGRFYSFALRVWKTSTSVERIEQRGLQQFFFIFLFFFREIKR